jgi:hypothetical protein
VRDAFSPLDAALLFTPFRSSFLGGSATRAIPEISTPFGTAIQSSSLEDLAARQAVQEGATLYRGGRLGISAGPEAQFWSLESPLNPGFAQRYGIPAKNMKFDFIEFGTLKPNQSFITRPAPGIRTNTGGGIEAVTNPCAVRLCGFIQP